MEGWMDGWMGGWMDILIYIFTCISRYSVPDCIFMIVQLGYVSSRCDASTYCCLKVQHVLLHDWLTRYCTTKLIQRRHVHARTPAVMHDLQRPVQAESQVYVICSRSRSPEMKDSSSRTDTFSTIGTHLGVFKSRNPTGSRAVSVNQ